MHIAWNSNFELHIPEIDKQHHRFIDLINGLNRALDENKTGGILHGLFLELFDYVSVHFDTEEKWMIRIGFPDFEKHCREHERFFMQVVAFKEMSEMERESGTVIRDIADFLTDWVRSHILEADKLLGIFYDPSALSLDEKTDATQCDFLLHCSFHKRSRDGDPLRQKWIQEYCNSAIGSKKCFRRRFKFNENFPPPGMAADGATGSTVPPQLAAAGPAANDAQLRDRSGFKNSTL